MKKQLLVVGIVLVLIAVVFSGCTEQENTISIADILQNSSQYIDRNVTIKGSLGGEQSVSTTEINGLPVHSTLFTVADGSSSIKGFIRSTVSRPTSWDINYLWTGLVIRFEGNIVVHDYTFLADGDIILLINDVEKI